MIIKMQASGFLIRPAILVLGCLIAFSALAGGASAQNPVPVINQPLVPDVAKPMGPAFSLAVNGTGFVQGSIVRWAGSARATTFVSTSRLAAAIPASDITQPQTIPVSVFNPGPGGGESNIVFFEVMPRSPSVALAASAFSSVGGLPTSVAAADFNRDGQLDLALANEGESTVTVLLGKGNGTFNTPAHYAIGSTSESVIAGDFNDDGMVDLAITDLDISSVSVLLGNGDGTFQSASDSSVGLVPYALVAGDFNADGKLDLAVTNNGGGDVSILLGNGNGTFNLAVDYAVALGPTGLVLGDFNGDGKLDLVVAAGNGLNILLGIGDGTFEPAASFEAGVGGNSMVVADFNHDGRLDLAVADLLKGNISVLLGNRDGTFQPVVRYKCGASPAALAVADLNGDGNLDLAVADDVGNGLRAFLGNGDGTFKLAVEFSTTMDLLSATVGDFNGDGGLDIAVADYSGTAGVLLQVPFISLSKDSLIFPGQLVGKSGTPQTVKLSNISALPLSLGDIEVTGRNAADFSQAHTCGSTLAPGKNCNIVVTFDATKIGPRTAAVTITDNGSQNPQSISLAGTGVTPGPNATLVPTSQKFVPQPLNTPSGAKSVNLANYGTVALDIASVMVNGDFLEANNCGSTVAAGASCTLGVSFKPSQTGLRIGTLSIMDNAPGDSQTVHLKGAGTIVKLDPTSLGFGKLQQCKKEIQTVTLTNVGSTSLSISGIQVPPASPQVFSQSNNCGSSVPAHQSCDVTVTFSTFYENIPPGPYKGSVVISDNGGGGSETIPLSGNVVSCHECCF